MVREFFSEESFCFPLHLVSLDLHETRMEYDGKAAECLFHVDMTLL